jgi:hypothetical protein
VTCIENLQQVKEELSEELLDVNYTDTHHSAHINTNNSRMMKAVAAKPISTPNVTSEK